MKNPHDLRVQPPAQRDQITTARCRRALTLLVLSGWFANGCGLGLAAGGADAAQLNTSPAIKASIPIGPGPIFLAMSADGSRLYAAANDGLHIVDTANRT